MEKQNIQQHQPYGLTSEIVCVQYEDWYHEHLNIVESLEILHGLVQTIDWW